jgi:hypothetical protein
MKPAKSGWIVSATLRKSALALERSGPGAGIQMIQAQNVVIADNFLDAIMTFLSTVGKEHFVVSLSVQNLPVVEAEYKKDKEDEPTIAPGAVTLR